MSTQEGFFHSLSKLIRELAATDDQDKMLNLILSAAVETLKAKAAVIFLNEEDSQDSIHNVAVAQIGLSKKYITREQLTPLRSVRNYLKTVICILKTPQQISG